MYMCLSLLHIRVQTECRRRREKRGEGEEGKRQGSGDKERIRRGFRERRGKGGRREERGGRKHMELFKNTAIYQSQAHSESLGASKLRRRKTSREWMLKEQRRRGYPRVTKQETERDRESNGQTSLHGRRE